MTTLIIEVSDELMAKLARQERPIQEVVVEALVRTLTNESAAVSRQPTKDEVVRRLQESDFIRDPNEWDTPGAEAWRNLPEAEKQQHLKERAEMYFPDAPASRAIIRGRKRLDTELTRAEMAERLLRLGIVHDPEEWDTQSACRWQKLSDEEKQQFIEETRGRLFPDSPASSFIIANRR
jgi:hypothetical protein